MSKEANQQGSEKEDLAPYVHIVTFYAQVTARGALVIISAFTLLPCESYACGVLAKVDHPDFIGGLGAMSCCLAKRWSASSPLHTAGATGSNGFWGVQEARPEI